MGGIGGCVRSVGPTTPGSDRMNHAEADIKSVPSRLVISARCNVIRRPDLTTEVAMRTGTSGMGPGISHVTLVGAMFGRCSHKMVVNSPAGGPAWEWSKLHGPRSVGDGSNLLPTGL